MIRGMFQNSGYFTQLVITLSVVLMMNIFASFIAIGVIKPLYGLDTLDFTAILSSLDARNIAILKVLQIIMSLLGFLFSALLLAYLFSPNSSQYLSMERKPDNKFLIGAFILVFVVFPFINMLGALNQQLAFPDFMKGFEQALTQKDEQNEKIMESFLSDTNVPGLLINIFMIGVIPAIGEELFFRGVLQRIFSGMTRNYHWGIWITAILFSLVHSKVFTFLPILILGALFGYLLVWTKSIWVPILAHFVNNTAAVLLYYLSNTDKIKEETLDYGATSDVWPFVLVSAVLTGVLIWYFYKNAVKEEEIVEVNTDQDS